MSDQEFNDALDRWVLYITLFFIIMWWIGY